MNQQALFPIDQVDPAEVEAPEHHIMRSQAVDAWNAAYLANFYARKAPEIIASGDTVRIRLYCNWADRQMQEAAA